MSWTADGSALSDHTDFVRVINEGGPGKRGANLNVSGANGEWSDYDKPYTGADILLEVGLKHDSTYQHLSELKKLFGKPNGFVTLQRVDDHRGTIEADVELLNSPQPTQDRFTYLFQLRNPEGFWKDATVTTVSGNPPSITTSGDMPIDDMVVTFSGPGTATHTDSGWGTASLEWEGSGTAIFTMSKPRSVVKGGVNAEGSAIISDEWWWRFTPGEAQSISTSVSITVDYRNKWA